MWLFADESMEWQWDSTRNIYEVNSFINIDSINVWIIIKFMAWLHNWAGLNVLFALHMHAAICAYFYTECSSERWMSFLVLSCLHYTLQNWVDHKFLILIQNLFYMEGKLPPPLFRIYGDILWRKIFGKKLVISSLQEVYMPQLQLEELNVHDKNFFLARLHFIFIVAPTLRG